MEFLKNVSEFFSRNQDQLLVGFIVTIIGGFILWIITRQNKVEGKDKQDDLQKNSSPVITNKELKKGITNNLTLKEKQLYSEIVSFYLYVEKTIMRFLNSISKEEYSCFNSWQYKEIMKLRKEIKRDPDVSEKFSSMALSFLGTIYDTTDLALAQNEKDKIKSSSYVSKYYSSIHNKYLEFKKLKER